jgi:hypothetical protein
MKAELFDAHGQPIAHLQYDTPFEMFWRGVRTLVLVLMTGLVLLLGAAYLSSVYQEAQDKAELAQLHHKGLHLYVVHFSGWWDSREFLAANPAEALQMAKNCDVGRLTTPENAEEQGDWDTHLYLLARRHQEGN